jgi:hypothetical protein
VKVKRVVSEDLIVLTQLVWLWLEQYLAWRMVA